MRIIAGKYKGQTLFSPKGEAVRPTSEQLRGALFNICGNRIEGASFLDLFAGSGAIGLEALSRGAAQVVFVEKDFLALQTIKKNIAKLGCERDCKILAIDAKAALKRLKHPFDLIYIDPPYLYTHKNCMELLQTIDDSSLLGPEGLLFLERAYKKEEEDGTFAHLMLKDKRTFGSTVLRQYAHLFRP